MQVIGEGEAVEFDGIRRRKTVLDPSRPPTRAGTIVTRTLHPPLGMTHFPSDDSDDDNSSFHPGFFERLRSRAKSNASRASHASSSVVDMTHLPPIPTDGASDYVDPHTDKDSYNNAMHQDTSYKPHETHIQFAELPPVHNEDNLYPPRPPHHMAKRQFSFQNVFHRNRGDSEASASGSRRPVSRNSRKSSRDGSKAAPGTEEERLGLVKGDSGHLMRVQSHGSDEMNPPEYNDDWGLGGRRADSPGFSPSRLPIADAHSTNYRGATDTPEFDPHDDPRYEPSRKPYRETFM